MAQIFGTRDNFNGGMIGDLAKHRLDLEKVQQGVENSFNYFFTPQGPMLSRGGTTRVALPTAGAERYIPFNFSTRTTAILHFTPGAVAVFSNTLPVPLEVPIVTPYTAEDLMFLHYYQINDIVYLVHENHPPAKLERRTDTHWTYSEVWGDLAGNTLSVVPGEPGYLLSEQWDWTGWDTGATDELYAFLLMHQEAPGLWTEAKRPPQAISNATVTTLPSSNKKEVRRLSGIFKATVGGVHRFYFAATAGGLDKAAARVGDYAFSAVTSEQFVDVTLAVDQEVPIWLIYGHMASGNGTATIRVSWTGQAKGSIPTANIRKPDTLTALGLRRVGTSYPPMLDENTTQATLAVSNNTGTALDVTASEDTFLPGHVGAYFEIAHRRELSFAEYAGSVGAFAGQSPALRVLGKVSLTSYGLWKANVYLERRPLGAITWEVLRSWKGNDDKQTVANWEEDVEVEIRVRVTNGVGTAASTAAVPRWTVELEDSKISGVIRITEVLTSKAAKCDVVRDLGNVLPTTYWTEGAFSRVRGYPRAIGGHEQRIWYAGTRTAPQRLHGSELSDIENFRRSTLATGGMSMELAAGEAHGIQWLASIGDALLIGTTAEEWMLGRVSEEQSMTPTSFRARPLSRFGSAPIQPVRLGEALIYVDLSERKVRRLTYEDERYANSDLTQLCPDVGQQKIIGIAGMHNPFTCLWVTTGDFTWLLTLDLEQAVVAWAPMFGPSKTIACIYNGSSTDTYLASGEMGMLRLGSDWMLRTYIALMPELDAYVDLEVTTGDVLTFTEPYVQEIWTANEKIAEVGGSWTATVTEPVRIGRSLVSSFKLTRPSIPMQDGSSRMKNHRISRVWVDFSGRNGQGNVVPAVGDNIPIKQLADGFVGGAETVLAARTARIDMPIISFSGPQSVIYAVHYAVDVYGS